MERETGCNQAEKHRLRRAIDAQVRRYLARGGRITVLDTAGSRPGRNAQAGDLARTPDLIPEID